MNKTAAVIVGAVLIIILVLFNTTYSIAFHEVGVRTRFGQILGVERDAGLHWKAPFFVDRVGKLDTRLQLLRSSLDTVATRDIQQVVVQAYVLWQIDKADDAGIQEFYKEHGSIERAAMVLQGELQSSLRSGIGKFNFGQLVGEQGNLKLAEDSILAELQRTKFPGVKVASVVVTQLVLPAKTTVAVQNRMFAEQKGRADTERGIGNSEAEAIRARAATDADKIRAFADERASFIRAQGDKEAAQFYATMKEGEPLAKFLAWLRAFEASLSTNTTVILDTTREPFHLIDANSPVGPDGIPVPRNSWENEAPAATQPSAGAPAQPKTEAARG